MSGEPGQGEGPSVPQPDQPKTETDFQKAAGGIEFKARAMPNPLPKGEDEQGEPVSITD